MRFVAGPGMPTAVRTKQRRYHEPVGNSQGRTPKKRNVAACYEQGCVDYNEQTASDLRRISPVSPIPRGKTSRDDELLGNMKACSDKRCPREPIHYVVLRKPCN